jgi:hypothetical protein
LIFRVTIISEGALPGDHSKTGAKPRMESFPLLALFQDAKLELLAAVSSSVKFAPVLAWSPFSYHSAIKRTWLLAENRVTENLAFCHFFVYFQETRGRC